MANPTVLSGDLVGDDSDGENLGDNSYHVVYSPGVTETAVLDLARGNCLVEAPFTEGQPVEGALIRAVDLPGSALGFIPVERFDPSGAVFIEDNDPTPLGNAGGPIVFKPRQSHGVILLPGGQGVQDAGTCTYSVSGPELPEGMEDAEFLDSLLELEAALLELFDDAGFGVVERFLTWQ